MCVCVLSLPVLFVGDVTGFRHLDQQNSDQHVYWLMALDTLSLSFTHLALLFTLFRTVAAGYFKTRI